MSKHPDPELVDDENPEWTVEDFARARPAYEVLPGIFGAASAQEMLKPRGRPRAKFTKERITIRLSPDVLGAFRASGNGWQTRVDGALREWLKTHSLA
jgi:uncharacterized protein (DUF4415 family)